MGAWSEAMSALVLALAGVATAGEPALQGLRSYEMGGYTLLAADDQLAGEIAGHVSDVNRVLAARFPHAEESSRVPTTLLALPTDLIERCFGNSRLGHHAPLPQAFENFVLLPSKVSADTIRSSVYHQMAHLFLRAHYPQAFPFWFDEGFAFVFEGARVDGDSAVLGYQRFMFTVRSRNRDLLDENARRHGNDLPHPGPDLDRRPSWIRLERVMSYTGDDPNMDAGLEARMQGESWALVHRALIADPKFGEQVTAYLQAVNDLMPNEQAVKASFGTDVSGVDHAMRAYISREHFQTSDLHLDPAPPTVTRQTHVFAPGEAEILMANLMLDAGASPARVEEMLSAAPNAPAVQVLQLRLAVARRDDAQLDRILASLQPSLGDTGIARGTGLALFERVHLANGTPGDDPRAAALQSQALELLDRSLQSRPDDPQAAWAFGMLSARTQRSLEVALGRLQRAATGNSTNADIAEAAARVHQVRGETAKMIDQLAIVLKYSRSREQRLWAAQIVDALRAATKTAPTAH